MSMMCKPKWPFLHMYRSHDVRHVEFRGLTGSQRTPGFWGVTTTPYSPQSNGMAKQKNHTLKEMMNTMLISSDLPQNMWGKAILSANYLLNKAPKKKAENTPYELWRG